MSAAAIPDVKALRVARSRRIRAQALVVLVLAFLVVGLWAASLMFGESFYGPSEVWRVIAGERVPGASFTVGTLRLPRATLAVLAGLAFGSAGVTFQTLLRNQLASPDVIGISAGASAAGVIGIVILGLNETTVSLLALAAAIGTAVAIYTLSYKGGFAGTRLILIGIGVSSMLGAVVTYTLAQASAWDLQVATRWLTGSLNSAGWPRVAPLAATCAVILSSMWVNSSKLAAMRFGDDTASGLGVKVFSVRVWTIVAAVTLVAVSGLGLVVAQRFQLVAGYSPFQAGLLLVVLAVGALPSSLVGGMLLNRIGERAPIVWGFAVGALGASIALLGVDSPGWFVAGLVVTGIGLGAPASVASSAIVTSVPASRAGMASSVEEVSYEFGNVLATAFFGGGILFVYGLAVDLPAGAPAGAATSLNEALRVSSDPRVVSAAVDAYDTAFAVVLAAVALVCLVGASVVSRLLRETAPGGADEPGGER